MKIAKGDTFQNIHHADKLVVILDEFENGDFFYQKLGLFGAFTLEANEISNFLKNFRKMTGDNAMKIIKKKSDHIQSQNKEKQRSLLNFIDNIEF